MQNSTTADERSAVAQFRHVQQCLRETRWVVALWSIQLIYCTIAIVTWGYLEPDQRPDAPDLIWGIPSWVVWGLFLPWGLQILAAWWFAIVILDDDEPYEAVADSGAREGQSG